MKLFKNIRILLAVAVSVLLASGLSSCRKETDDENGANYYINLSPKELFATKKGYAVDGEPIKLQVASNIYWQLTQPDNEEWISVDKKGGSGTEEIVFTVDVNKGVARQAKFVFETNGSLKQELIVRQESAEKVLEYIRVGFGDGASLENVNSYEDWQHEGVGALRSQFWGQGTFVDKASASSGYDEASGGGNILFAETGGNGSIFQINTIGIKQDINFALYFASMTTQAAFDKDEFKIFISKDESNWTPVEYTRSANAGWTLARVPFFIKGGVDNLYIRFVSSVEGAYRLDDVVLAEGAGDGENITFIEDIQHTEESLIFFDDFEWVPGKEGGNRDNFGGDDDGNMTTIMEGAPVKWTLDPSNCYKRMGMVKLGRTKIGGGMITPNLEDVGTGNRTLRLMFDVAVPFTSDYDDIKVVVLNAGKINGESSVTFNIGENQRWMTAEYLITDATANTRIQFMPGISDDEQSSSNRSNRFVLDNVRVYRIDNVNEGGATNVLTSPSSFEFGKIDEPRKFKLDINKSWTVESDTWITVDPAEGVTGVHYPVITVEDNNSGAARTGAIRILVRGEEVASLPVVQTLEEPVTQVEAPRNLTLLQASTTTLAIGWDELQGDNKRSFKIEIASTADGQAIQSYSPTFATAKYYLNRFAISKLTANTNYFVRVKTISTTTGLDDSDFVTLPVKTATEPVLGPDVVYYHNFDGSDWGGDHILQAWGYRPAGDVPGSTPPDAEMTSLRDPNAGGSGSYQYMTGALRTSRRIDDWTDVSTIYENQGYIKFGSGSARGRFSVPLSGKLDNMSTIDVSFKLGAWVERSSEVPYTPSAEAFSLRVSVASGSGVINGASTFTVTELLAWKEFSLTVSGADATTVLKFEAEGTNPCRFCFDDLLIKKVATQNSVTLDKSTVSLGADANLSDVVQVTASGAWTSSSSEPWLTLSPDSGNGGAAENVTFTAQANTDFSQRAATVTFSIAGEILASVTVTQDAAVPAQKVEEPQNLTALKATTTNVALGWDELQTANGRKFRVEIASSSMGEALQSYDIEFNLDYYYQNRLTIAKLSPATTYYARVKTLSTQSGYGDSDFTEMSFTTEALPVYGPDVIYAHNFDGCMWGGDHLMQTWGFRPASMSDSKSPDAAMDDRKNPNDGGSNNIGSMTGELKTSRRFEGWNSTSAYEFPGYIKLGRGGNYVSEIRPPVLSDISGTSDIEVTFKLAAWMERNKTTPPYAITLDKFTLFVTVESGAGTVEGTNEFTVTNPFVWDNCSVVIKDADATTRIRIESKRPAGETTGWWRCCLDDLVIKYKQP